MSRRALVSVLVVMLGLWGLGLPRFAHVMTAHVPASACEREESRSASVASVRCCAHHGCSLAPTEPTEPEAADDEETSHAPCSSGCSGGCGESGHCSICDLLATLVTSVPGPVLAAMIWSPLQERAIVREAQIAAQRAVRSHPARGPPAAA